MRKVASVVVKSTLASVLLLFYCSGRIASNGNDTDQDTVEIARSEKSFTVSGENKFYQATLDIRGSHIFTLTKRTWLKLYRPAVNMNPDGVYEIYLSKGKSEVSSLKPDSPEFVNVFDVYQLTSNSPPTMLTYDVTKILAANTGGARQLTITILFRGNITADKTESRDAGEIAIGGIGVVQEK